LNNELSLFYVNQATTLLLLTPSDEGWGLRHSRFGPFPKVWTGLKVEEEPQIQGVPKETVHWAFS